MEVIAEGVQTELQRKFLHKNGCKRYQGYLFSKLVPIDQFDTLFNVKHALRFVRSLARLRERVGGITSHLVAVFWQAGGVASGFVREAGMASFIIKGGSLATSVSPERCRWCRRSC